MTAPRIAVIGAGLTGLTVAYRLGQSSPGSEVVCFERAGRVGGKLKTEYTDGFTIEHGPDVFLARKPWASELCRELELETIPTNQTVKGSFIRRGNRLHPLPAGFGGLVPTSWWGLASTSLLSPLAKIRLALEPWIPAGSGVGDESLGAFVRRRLGRETYERLVRPLMGGIYGGNVDALSLEATFPQFRAMEKEHGSLVRAARKRPKTAGSVFHTLAGGMQSLTDALLAASGAELRVGSEVKRVYPDSSRWIVEATEKDSFDAVICTAPAYAAAGMLSSLDEVAAVLNQIPYNSSAVLTLAFREDSVPRALDGYGYLNPEQEGKPVRACTWSSSKIPGRAPEGSVLLRLFFGRSPDDPWLTATDGELMACAAEELQGTLGIQDKPEFHRVQRWIREQPAYTLGHPARMAQLDSRLKDYPGLFLTGAAYRGVGIPDCVRQANETAQSATTYLQGE
ncbi:MAG: oxygen-dependent protoporphyrinogen oxidase [Rhodothermales bacterium]|jgi:oxygen-dependent protoporphyrinogen oxidase